jgi:hypothetical protein
MEVIMAIDQTTSLEDILKKWAIAFKESSNKDSFGCQHDSKHYTGFSEEYEYCSKCDAKKVNGEWQKSEKLQKLFDLF